MPQFNDIELTAAVIKSFEDVENPRVKFLMEQLVTSLHDFVRKTDLTFAEWEYAIELQLHGLFFYPRPHCAPASCRRGGTGRSAPHNQS